MIPDSAPYAVDLPSYQIRSSNANSEPSYSYDSAILRPPRLPPAFGAVASAFFVSLWDPRSMVRRFWRAEEFRFL